MRLLLLAAGLVAVAACDYSVGPVNVISGSGHVKTESRTVSDFDRVALGGDGTLVITQGSTEALKITADDNILPKLRSDVEGGTLQLGPQNNTSVRPTTTIRYDLTLKHLHGVTLAGSADMRSDALSTDSLELHVAGSGSARIMKLTTDAVTVAIAGSGSVNLTGTAGSQTVDISGSGTYQAGNLASQQTSVNVSGSGDCRLNVASSLSVRILGSGHVSYSGSPVVNQQILGSGSLTHSG
jgi:hypothetical protein